MSKPTFCTFLTFSTLTVKGKFVEITTTNLHKVQNSDYKSTDRFLQEKCYMLLSANPISGLSSSEFVKYDREKSIFPHNASLSIHNADPPHRRKGQII